MRVNLFLISKSCFGIRVFSEMGALKRQQKDPYRAKAYFEAAQSLKNYPKVLIVLHFGDCYYWPRIVILMIDFSESYVWSRSYVD